MSEIGIITNPEEFCNGLTESIINELKSKKEMPEVKEWINNRAAMELLDCAKDKLAELQAKDKIVYTKATGKILNSRKSILKFLDDNSNDII